MYMNQKKGTIFLFTNSYPYSKSLEDSFIEPELNCLYNYFKEIVVIPREAEGIISKNIPDFIIIDKSLSKYLEKNFGIPRIKHIIFAITSIKFYYEIAKKLWILLSLNSLKTLILHTSISCQTKIWLRKNFENIDEVTMKNYIFYTFWLNDVSTGLCLYKEDNPKMKIISRVHGGDLYEERFKPPYIPYRPYIFHHINKVFAASHQGMAYLSKKYPRYINIFEKSLLGVPESGFINQASRDGRIRIVSCSFIDPIKRVDLIIEGLSILGKLKPDIDFIWTHIGDGPNIHFLEDFAKGILPKNVNFKFLGRLQKEQVILFYKNNPVDLFINSSASEGTPVSIMEAESCGIPIIATSVGGNQEIVNHRLGKLINENPSPEMIAQSIIELISNSEILTKMRSESIKNWENHYNAKKNYRLFSRQLLYLLK